MKDSQSASRVTLPLALVLAVLLPRSSGTCSPAPDAEALVERVRTKIVLIDVQVGRGGRSGTGFFAAPGQVLTSDHVIAGADGITVWSNGVAYRARVAARDTELDLALLALPDAALLIKPLPLAAASTALLGEPVLIVGSHSAPVRDAARQSLISGRFRGTGWLQWPAGHYVRSLELDAGVEPGDSGSPVLRLRDGAVIGVVRARTTPGQDGLSFRAWAVPIDVAFPLLRRGAGAAQQIAGPDPDEEFYLRRP